MLREHPCYGFKAFKFNEVCLMTFNRCVMVNVLCTPEKNTHSAIVQRGSADVS